MRRFAKTIVEESNGGMFSIREGDWKLELGLGSGGFSEPSRGGTGAGRSAWTALQSCHDPRELYNVYAQHPDIVARLTKVLERVQGERAHTLLIAAAESEFAELPVRNAMIAAVIVATIAAKFFRGRISK